MDMTRAVIPAAGLGKRSKPITDAVPKEMFPIGSHPAIEWVIMEAVASGCTDVAVVISPGKEIIRKYFTTYCPDLGKRCNLSFLVQSKPLGLGHALLSARDFCKEQPFAVLLPDDLIYSKHLPLLQMTMAFRKLGGAVIALTQEPAENAGRYGRLRLKQLEGQALYKVEAISARTTPVKTESFLAGVGRYLLLPKFLEYAAKLLDQPRAGELSDGMILQHMLEAGEPVYGVHINGKRFDISIPDGYMKAWQYLRGKKLEWKR